MMSYFMHAASAATFSRFIPTVKARFDYGAMIFILTFSLVSISGYRVEELVMMAQNRASTVAIGISLVILVSMLCWPVWAGDHLHNQTINNLDKLANSLEGIRYKMKKIDYSCHIIKPDDKFIDINLTSRGIFIFRSCS